LKGGKVKVVSGVYDLASGKVSVRYTDAHK
jgi:hypothetical protein